jgi:hypothetical protein
MQRVDELHQLQRELHSPAGDDRLGAVGSDCAVHGWGVQPEPASCWHLFGPRRREAVALVVLRR